MKTFKCGPELAEILVKNGFVNTTAKGYPGHVNNPGGKRMFRTSPASKNCIMFDYITLKSNSLQFYETSVTEDQLKAIICFHKLHHISQYAVKASTNRGLSGVVSLLRDLQYGRSKPQLAKNIMQVYESVSL